MSGGNWVGLGVGVVALLMIGLGDPIQKWWAKRRLRRHHCPAPCEESRHCRCGCEGLHSVGERQEKCAVCGAPIVRDDESEDDRDWGPYRNGAYGMYSPNEITSELPAPKGFTSWGWERDREFRRARHEGEGADSDE